MKKNYSRIFKFLKTVTGVQRIKRNAFGDLGDCTATLPPPRPPVESSIPGNSDSRLEHTNIICSKRESESQISENQKWETIFKK